MIDRQIIKCTTKNKTFQKKDLQEFWDEKQMNQQVDKKKTNDIIYCKTD